MNFIPIILEYRYKISIPDLKRLLIDNDKTIKIKGESTEFENPFRCYSLRKGKITHNKKMMFFEWTIEGEYFENNSFRNYMLNKEGKNILINLFNKTFPDNYFKELPDLKQYLDDYRKIQEFLQK